MTRRANRYWTFPAAGVGTPVSNSIDLGTTAIAAVAVPAAAGFEATTAALRIERSLDGMNVSDADASWLPPMTDDAGTVIEIPVSATAAVDVKVDLDLFRGLGRCRLRAVTGAGANVNQDGQVVYPALTEVR